MSFAPFAEMMRADGLPELAIEAFARHYAQLVAGETGLMPEASIEPVGALPASEALGAGCAALGRAHLHQAVVVKLNGGLGTSMGLDRAKALLPVRDGLTFLDLIARQVLRLECPLLLMNSFATQAQSLAALEAYPRLGGGLPLDFLQHRVPKVDRCTLQPVVAPAPALAWCPPGHGDLYTALFTRGTLDALRAAGRRYLFVSNADNLGAVLDPALLGHVIREGLPFLMEVADRTAADRKGGHLARWGGRLVLREAAQCAPEDAEAFQDVGRHRYFNTNNLWIDLDALAAHGAPSLPLIRNAKTVDPTDLESTPVYHLESAMGAAIGVIPGAAAIRVPRTRFAPVKTCSDLLAVRSDAYQRTPDDRVVLAPGRAAPVNLDLDARYFRTLADLALRVPATPSLRGCDQLTIRGDVRFAGPVTVRGVVRLVNDGPTPRIIPAGAVLG